MPIGATWIWAKYATSGDIISGDIITGETYPAAGAKFTFDTMFYLCGNNGTGIFGVAADDFVDVSINGIPVLTNGGGAGAMRVVVIPSPKKKNPLHQGLNFIDVTVTNQLYPDFCIPDEYQCNPAGFVFAATFDGGIPPDKLPACTNPNGPINTADPSNCTVCECFTPSFAHWVGSCQSPPPTCMPPQTLKDGVCTNPSPTCTPPFTLQNGVCAPLPPTTCTGMDGKTPFNVNDTESAPDCPPGQMACGRSHQCTKNGTWNTPIDACIPMPAVGVGEICGNPNKCPSVFATCPTGIACSPQVTTTGNESIGCALLGIHCPVTIETADSYCGSLNPAVPLGLGLACGFNSQCASGYCDRGDNTRNTNMCMPSGNTGQKNDPCTADNQCSNSIPLKCMGLYQDVYNNWHPGTCQ